MLNTSNTAIGQSASFPERTEPRKVWRVHRVLHFILTPNSKEFPNGLLILILVECLANLQTRARLGSLRKWFRSTYSSVWRHHLVLACLLTPNWEEFTKGKSYSAREPRKYRNKAVATVTLFSLRARLGSLWNETDWPIAVFDVFNMSFNLF